METIKIGDSHVYDYAWRELGNPRLREDQKVDIAQRLLQEIWKDKSLSDINLLISSGLVPAQLIDRAEALKTQIEKREEILDAFERGDNAKLLQMEVENGLCEELKKTLRTCIEQLPANEGISTSFGKNAPARRFRARLLKRSKS